MPEIVVGFDDSPGAQDAVAFAAAIAASCTTSPSGPALCSSSSARPVGDPSAVCPVAIVPRGFDGTRPVETVGVVYDGSVESEVALAAACQVARRFGASLRVIRVFDATRVGSPALMTIPARPASTWTSRRSSARPRRGRRGAARRRFTPRFVAGAPGPELAAHTVIRKAHSPVVVLPRGSHGLESLFSAAAETAAQ